jgi:hypothetical protein
MENDKIKKLFLENTAFTATKNMAILFSLSIV